MAEFTPLQRIAIFQRDGGCLGPAVGMPGDCMGRLQLDHIQNGGTGYKGPATLENGASLCLRHHQWKTEHAKKSRVLLIAEVRRRIDRAVFVAVSAP